MALPEDAIESLWADLKTASGVDLTYQYDQETPVPLTAVPARTEHQGVTSGAIAFSEEVRDWIVHKDDLGEEPRVGATCTSGGVVYTVGIPELDREWDWVGQARLLYRIHTFLSQET